MIKKKASKVTVQSFLSDRIAASSKTQRQIADECGFDTANVISMMKSGLIKLPLGRVGPIAKALDCDPAQLLRIGLGEYIPETWQAIEQFLPRDVITANELALINQFRIATGNADPRPVALSMTGDTAFLLVTESF
jgi:hypothetical protein